VCYDVERVDRRRLAQLDDSKRVPPELREELFTAIMRMALQVVVITVPAAEIDRRGLHKSNLRALGQALESLDPAPDVCLTDGFSVPGCGREHRRLIGGDGRSAAIAAASIVAKVVRDRTMRRMDALYPGYGFSSHVGYITPRHSRIVRERGPCDIHRRSFQALCYLSEEEAAARLSAA
jgi:ribonuclease HII